MRTRLALMTIATAVAIAVAGCGPDSPSAPPTTPPASPTAAGNGIAALTAADILSKAIAALQRAGTVHLTGLFDGSTLDATTSGGNVQIRSSGPTGTVEGRVIGTDIYLKADATFYKMLLPAPRGEQFAAQRADKWVRTSATKDPEVAQFLSLFSPAAIVQVAVLTAQATKGAVAQVDGAPAIELTVSSAGAGGASVFIATTGEPLPVQIKLGPSTVKLTYGEKVDIAAPTPDLTV